MMEFQEAFELWKRASNKLDAFKQLGAVLETAARANQTVKELGDREQALKRAVEEQEQNLKKAKEQIATAQEAAVAYEQDADDIKSSIIEEGQRGLQERLKRLELDIKEQEENRKGAAAEMGKFRADVEEERSRLETEIEELRALLSNLKAQAQKVVRNL